MVITVLDQAMAQLPRRNILMLWVRPSLAPKNDNYIRVSVNVPKIQRENIGAWFVGSWNDGCRAHMLP